MALQMIYMQVMSFQQLFKVKIPYLSMAFTGQYIVPKIIITAAAAARRERVPLLNGFSFLTDNGPAVTHKLRQAAMTLNIVSVQLLS